MKTDRDRALDDLSVAAQIDWQPRRDAGLNRLRSFTPSMAHAYERERNYDRGPRLRSNVSLLSPWLRHRLILETEVLDSALQIWSLDEAEKFVEEVFWRGYFKGWLEHYPQVWKNYRRDLDDAIESLGAEVELARRFESATSGETGIDCFDVWVRELTEIGYLHNHARMWFASIWIFTLKLPWQLGADFFYRHLLDGDPASNTLSWRWVAGLHTKGKTYLARSSNIAKYSEARFSDVQELARDAQPLTEPDYGPAQALDSVASNTPTGEFGLLVTHEDCTPETLSLPRPPVAACGIGRLENHVQLPIDWRVREFSKSAVDDALRRIEHEFGISTAEIDDADWCNQIIDWAHALGIKEIVTAYAPVGPTQEALKTATHYLERHELKLTAIKRGYDNVVWPFASKGYFAIKKQIPAIIESLQLPSN
ncbi:MAG: FAD-binding domain-containing protein [Pseudomonadota bacterium]